MKSEGLARQTLSSPTAEKFVSVAFCIDPLMETPLHVAASSLLRNLKPGYIARFYLMLSGVAPACINSLRRTLDGTDRKYEIIMLKSDETRLFSGFRALHGNLTPYHRLLLPGLVEQDKLLYLDADTQVEIDVSPLFEIDMGSKALGAVVDGTVSTSLEATFFASLGKAPQSPSFNSGVMLFNIPEWRRQCCSERTLAFCREFTSELKAADQTALNALFAEDCVPLDGRYNVKLYSTSANGPGLGSGMIIHFVGSPKPWDIGGRRLLPHSTFWFEELKKTGLPKYKQFAWLSRSAWMRVPRILGGYRMIFRERFRKAKHVRQL